MNIIRHGRHYSTMAFRGSFSFTCENCGCKYEEFETRCEYNQPAGVYTSVCPECDCINNPEHKED